MFDNQETTPKDFSLRDLSTSGTNSKPAEEPSTTSRNNSQTPHEKKQEDEENNCGYVLNVPEGDRKFQTATDMPEEQLHVARKRLIIAVEKTASGYELLGEARVVMYETRNAAADVKASVRASELQEATIRHEMACKEALASARNMARLIGTYASVSCQDKELLNSLTSCLDTAVLNLQASKERLQFALD
jgi:hypothetical protein